MADRSEVIGFDMAVREKVKKASSSGALSKVSVYEQTFKTRKRSIGRPSGDVEPLFASAADLSDIDALVVSTAKRRAYSVVHEENRERLQEVFLTELQVLKRRGAQAVADDLGLVWDEEKGRYVQPGRVSGGEL